MKLNRAIIPIQGLYCENCANRLVDKLSEIKYISQIGANCNTSEIYFNFRNIQGVSDVENMLTDLGYNPVGEKLTKRKGEDFFCRNSLNTLCINIG